MSELAALATIPDGITPAAELIDSLDSALSVGFGRLGSDQLKALDSLAKTFTGTPLEARLNEAVTAVKSSTFVEKHFVALAAARASLQGAMHDALHVQVSKALGRTPAIAVPEHETDVQATPSHHDVYLESARQWLMEVALAGFLQLSPETVLPFAATLEKLQSEPGLLRQSSLLTGFFEELASCMPISAMPSIPLYRWVDLWSRAMIVCTKPPTPLRAQEVSGDFYVLGVDFRSHGFFVSALFHGVLVSDGKARAVRATVSTYKVDVLTGQAQWRMMAQKAGNLIAAFVNDTPLQLTAMPLAGSGDFFWDDKKAKASAKTSLEETAKKYCIPGTALDRMPLPGMDRHPAQLAEPVYVSEFSAAADPALGAKFAWKGAEFPLAGDRMTHANDFSVADLVASRAFVALLRYDNGGWGLQPLAVFSKTGKGAPARACGEAAAKGIAKAGAKDPLGILKERASKLLRQKS